jgi:POT family proton-dependent oligopeptide transporter
MYSGALPITAAQVADAAGYLLLAIVLVFFAWLFFAADWTPAERLRLYAIAVLFVAQAIFWSEFEQAGSTLNLFGDLNTRTSMFGWTFPSSYQSLQPLFIITFAPVFAWSGCGWANASRRARRSSASACCWSAAVLRSSSSPRNCRRPG